MTRRTLLALPLAALARPTDEDAEDIADALARREIEELRKIVMKIDHPGDRAILLAAVDALAARINRYGNLEIAMAINI